MLKKITIAAKLAAIILAVLIQTAETRADWGDFDTTFGFAGVALDTVSGHTPRGVTLQGDGKILVTGHRTNLFGGKSFFLRRYLSDGQLDTSFGTNGAAIAPEANFRGSDYRGDGIVIQPNGRIAVAGWANGYHAVWQFTSGGKRDKTFGEDGLQILTSYPVICSTYPTMNSGYPEMNIQSGKLLLSLGKRTGDTCQVVLLRLTSSGTLDSSFGTAGESLTTISVGPGGFGTVVETDEKITIGGVKFNDISAKGLERKLANGQDDPTFPATTGPSFGAISPGLVRMTNGKYVRRWGNSAPTSVTLMLDKFSSQGFLELSQGVYNQAPTQGCPDIFTNQNDGKLIVQYVGVLIRINTELDQSSIEIDDCSNLRLLTNFARAAIQPDDKMVIAGVYNNKLILARRLPN